MTSAPSPLVARFIRRYGSVHGVGGVQPPGSVPACVVSDIRPTPASR
jgi:hypothetical protein